MLYFIAGIIVLCVIKLIIRRAAVSGGKPSPPSADQMKPEEENRDFTLPFIK